MNYFEYLPDEIMVHVFYYLSDLYPTLRRVNRQMHRLVGAIDKRKKIYYANCAVVYGHKINMECITAKDIRRCIYQSYFGLLLFANYTWKAGNLDNSIIQLLSDLHDDCVNRLRTPTKLELCGVQYRLEDSVDVERFLGNLFGHIVSKYFNKNTVAELAVSIDNVYVIDKILELGFKLDHCAPEDACSFNVMRKLYESGCRFRPSAIAHIICDKARFRPPQLRKKTFEAMCEYVMRSSYKITDGDFTVAAKENEKDIVMMMFKFGYKLSMDIADRHEWSAEMKVIIERWDH